MRLFTAVDICPEVHAKLAGLLDALRPLARLRWSPAENLHITTKFIGEWPEERLRELQDSLRSVPRVGEITIEIRDLGWFPDARRPRVLYAGVDAGPELAELAARTSSALKTLGIPEEQRPYQPHLTLARTRDDTSQSERNAVERALASLPHAFGSFRATSQELYRSAGGKYSRMDRYSIA
jgi:2'-5' RNA ligase